MSRKETKRIAVDGGAAGLTQNPFASLDLPGLPVGQPAAPVVSVKESRPVRGRLDIRRETAGRHGKAVVVITPAEALAEEALRDLARRLQRTLGVGGTVKQGSVEIQGDRLAEVRKLLDEDGYRCRQTGG